MRPAKFNPRRIVVKIGSSLLTADGTRLDTDFIMQFCTQVAQARQRDCEIVIVSSGAVAAGVQRLGWKRRPKKQADVQVAAAVGQMRLIDAFEEGFSRHGLHAGQTLLTAEDIAKRRIYLSAREALQQMLMKEVVPVINENDVIATDAVHFGDNDWLAAQIANLLEADLLLLLTDIDGLRTDGGRGELVREGKAADSSLKKYVEDSSDGIGSGGMGGKLRAAKVAAFGGAHCLIANGRAPTALARVLDGDKQFGTFLVADKPKLSARKQWLASGLVFGELWVDEGAERALVLDKKSLLPAGMKRVSGEFARGDLVMLANEGGWTIGYAQSNYDSVSARKLCGVRSADIVKTLGYRHEEEIAHRDNISITIDESDPDYPQKEQG